MKIFRQFPLSKAAFKASGSMNHKISRKSLCITLLISLLLPLFIASCSSSNEDDTLELLGSVPAEAEFVAVVNLNEIVVQSGGEVKDGNIKDVGSLKKLLDEAKSKKSDWVLEGNSGIDVTSAVIFSYKGNFYFTCLIKDAEQVRENINADYPGEWEKVGDFYTKNSFMVSDSRLWVADHADTGQILKFMDYSEAESFNSVDYSKTLAKSSDAISFYGSLDGILDSTNLAFSQKSLVRLASGMFFKDPKYVIGNGNYKNQEMILEATLCNSEFKPANCELDMSAIDINQVAALDGNANTVIAMAVSQKLVKQLLDVASSVGGAMPQEYTQLLEPLDGTIAFAAQANNKNEGNGFRASVATSGKDNASLLQILQSFGEVKIDGKIFNISYGSYGKGKLDVKQTAESFKGASLGFAMTIDDEKNPFTFTMLLVPDGKTLKLKVIVKY